MHSKPNFLECVEEAAKALKLNNSEQDFAGKTSTLSAISSKEFERTFSRREKANLGGVVKRLLDFTRATRLQGMGYDAELVIYTTRSIENRLLVGI